MAKLPKWRGRTLKVIGWMCLIPICLVVLAFLIGWVGDLTATAKWEAGRQRALERVQKAKTAEFQSGYDFAVIKANAWDYYLNASGSLDSLDNRKLDSLVFKTLDIKEANRLLSKYKREITLWDSGACSRYCRTNVEYEKGYNAPIPNYIALQKMLKLALLKGRLEVASGQTRQGALTYSKALKTAMDFSGGSMLTISRMVGIVAGRHANRMIAGDIGRFDSKSLLLMQETLENTEKSWPPIHPTIDMEAISIYFAADGQDAVAFIEGGADGKVNANPIVRIVRRAGYAMLCWKQYFSVKRNLMNFSGILQQVADETSRSRSGLWSTLEPLLKRNQEGISKKAKGDVFLSIAMPNHTIFFSREFELRMGLRVLKDALILREYSLKNGKYPADLYQAVKDSPEYNDIANGLPLRYVINQDKSVLLYSVGLNLKNDEGKNFVLSEGITRSTDNEDRDDIGIKLE
ncbi:hypothetical protein HZA73_08410 [candidate division TA06 bacterium]|nr:hypothetical protein [candidate division TA06 bacterium]